MSDERPTVPDVLPMVHAYYRKPGNSVGGNLHIVLDDDNILDSDILFCRRQAEEANDVDGVALADVLLQLSKTQRLKIARTHRGDLDPMTDQPTIQPAP